MAHRSIWDGIGYHLKRDGNGGGGGGVGFMPDSKTVVAVQAVSAAMASGVSALVTMPLDTIKTRLQVLDEGCNRKARVAPTVKKLMSEGGLSACYRGLGHGGFQCRCLQLR